MKKKIINILYCLIVLFSLSLFYPIKSMAVCQPNSGTRCNLTSCVAGGKVYCCNTQIECNTLQVGSGTTPSTTAIDPTTNCGGSGIATAIGCVGFQDTDSFVGTIFRWSVGIGGGVAFLLIVFGGFLIMTSTGNPERLNQGKEIMTSAISGIILLILSIFVLRVIGVDILKIPGFGTTPSGGGKSFLR